MWGDEVRQAMHRGVGCPKFLLWDRGGTSPPTLSRVGVVGGLRAPPMLGMLGGVSEACYVASATLPPYLTILTNLLTIPPIPLPRLPLPCVP